tara:strand:+ start:173 stop:616 length:444 start_codon:yes stop_codon:yes gene_type:complete
MFILKHKKFPFYLTWEADDNVFETYKDQISMEIKENGLNSFDLSIVNGNQFASVEENKPRQQEKKPDIKQEVNIKPEQPKKIQRTVKPEAPKGVPTQVKGKGPRSVGDTKNDVGVKKPTVRKPVKNTKTKTVKPSKPKRGLFNNKKS